MVRRVIPEHCAEFEPSRSNSEAPYAMKPHITVRSASSLGWVGILLLFCLSNAVQAQFKWQTNTDRTITLARYTGASAVVNIPSTVSDLPVTVIGDNAFVENGKLTSVTIPDSVTSIGSSAFHGCSRLTSVTIPDGVVTLGEYVFQYCSALTNVTFGEGLVSIGDYAFDGADLLTSIVVPDSVTTIGEGAFFIHGLTHVTLGSGVTNLGPSAFGSSGPGAPCSVFFKGNAPTADSSLFRWSIPLLSSGERPVTVYYLSGATGWSNSFAGRPTVKLNSPPQFESTPDGFEYFTDGVRAVVTRYFGTNAAAVVSPAINGFPVTEIGPFAFSNSWELTDVTIPDGVLEIGEYAFYGCPLVTVTFRTVS